MNKSDITKKLACSTNISLDEAELVLAVVVDVFKKTLLEGQHIELRGFGTFTVKEYQPRMGRNPQTGAPLALKARRSPSFHAGKELKELINTSSPLSIPGA